MLSSERPETLRESGADEGSACSLKDVKVGALNHSVVLRNARPGRFMQDTKCSASELQFRGVV